MLRRLSAAARVVVPVAVLATGGVLITPLAASATPLGANHFTGYGPNPYAAYQNAVTNMNRYESRTHQTCTEGNPEITPMQSFPPSYKADLLANCSAWGIPG
ncbi:hypothetical protein AB0D37_39695 [Streptomyces sp. NPDC048384]|uniref:hypothetical protein n=1 Tax=Streptomyces sp. NPDC048384 TaxID=3155487 RepID=UPI0034368456